MTILEQMLQKLKTEFSPTVIELVNESHLHHRPSGAETHFRLLIVSEKFQGMSRIDRQRQINQLFEYARDKGLHALTQRALTPQEWESQKDGAEFTSPSCQHKN